MTAREDSEPQFRVLEGQFIRELRSPKGKLKGIGLRTVDQEYAITLPKYLRPMLVRELELGDLVRVWVSPQKAGWEAFNVVPLRPKMDLLEPRPQVASAQVARQPSRQPQPCVQVCRKGSCCKRGSGEVYRAIEGAIATNSNLQNLKLESTGCLKECKKGPALRLSPTKEVFTRVTPQNVVAILEEHCSQPAPTSLPQAEANNRSPASRP